jgi:glycine amidinotransferase
MTKVKLNTNNDWDPLREVIVGSAENYMTHDREISFELFFHDNLLFRSDWAYPRVRERTEAETAQTKAASSSWRIKQQYVEELNEDVEDLVQVLRSLGITVYRPITLPYEAESISGLGWKATPVPSLNVRDNTLIIGDEIIETPPSIRSRYLETRLLAPIFMHYFNNGAKWTTMPRPLLTDNSFDRSYVEDARKAMTGFVSEPIDAPEPSPYDVGWEMLIDGAQFLRLGRDIIVNTSTENHRLACDWLDRHLGSRYRIHRTYRMSDNHVDTMLVALRPGVFLGRHKGLLDFLPAPFLNWEMIVPPPPEEENFPAYDDGDLVLAGPIDLNVLSVNSDTVLVNESCSALMRTLEREHFTVIPVRHRHRRLFGGGFHCFTLDTVRDGDLEDYLDLPLNLRGRSLPTHALPFAKSFATSACCSYAASTSSATTTWMMDRSRSLKALLSTTPVWLAGS